MGNETRFASYLSLFTSFGTLMCCALPSLLVLLGLGATVASFLAAAPWLVALSHHKNWVFLIAGALIGGSFLYEYRLAPHIRPCPVDDSQACTSASRMSRIVLWISGGLYCIGIVSAYVLGPLLMKFGQG